MLGLGGGPRSGWPDWRPMRCACRGWPIRFFFPQRSSRRPSGPAREAPPLRANLATCHPGRALHSRRAAPMGPAPREPGPISPRGSERWGPRDRPSPDLRVRPRPFRDDSLLKGRAPTRRGSGGCSGTRSHHGRCTCGRPTAFTIAEFCKLFRNLGGASWSSRRWADELSFDQFANRISGSVLVGGRWGIAAGPLRPRAIKPTPARPIWRLGSLQRLQPGGKKVCFRAAPPKTEVLAGPNPAPAVRATPPTIFISSRPTEETCANEVSGGIIGYPFKPSTDGDLPRSARPNVSRWSTQKRRRLDQETSPTRARPARGHGARSADLTIKGTSGKKARNRPDQFSLKGLTEGAGAGRIRSASLKGVRETPGTPCTIRHLPA